MSDIDDTTQLPETHPLVKAYAAERAANKQLKADLASKTTEAEANAEKAKKYDEHTAANATELEKAIKRAEEAEARNAEHDKAEQARTAQAELDKTRDDVAKAKGLTASLLRGTSKEEFEQHADDLIAAGIKATPAPSKDGQGDNGDPIDGGKELTAEELVKAATA